MKVRIPTPLRSYTNQQSMVDADGTTVSEILADLDRRFPGIRFRVVDEQGRLRKHMKIFVDQDMTRDLATPVSDSREVVIMQALSGGAAADVRCCADARRVSRGTARAPGAF